MTEQRDDERAGGRRESGGDDDRTGRQKQIGIAYDNGTGMGVRDDDRAE